MTKKEKKRILIAEDEQALTFILTEGLRDLYEVDTANDGMEALSKIQEKSYDLLLTDYKMPQMTGITLAQQVRKLSPDTAIVIQSHEEKEEWDWTSEFFANGFQFLTTRLIRFQITPIAFLHPFAVASHFRAIPVRHLRPSSMAAWSTH